MIVSDVESVLVDCPLVKRRSISYIKTRASALAAEEKKVESVCIKASIVQFHDIAGEFWYAGCASKGCNRKITRNTSSGRWYCAECDKEYDQCQYQYMVRLLLADFTGNLWVTLFGEAVSGVHIAVSVGVERLSIFCRDLSCLDVLPRSCARSRLVRTLITTCLWFAVRCLKRFCSRWGSVERCVCGADLFFVNQINVKAVGEEQRFTVNAMKQLHFEDEIEQMRTFRELRG